MAFPRRFNQKGQGLALPSQVVSLQRQAGDARGAYNPTLVNDDEKAQIRYGGQQTYETPIRQWYGDQTFTGPGGPFSVFVPARVVTATFGAIVGTVLINVNGGGFRTLFGTITLTNTEIDSISIILQGVGSSVIVQLAGL